MYDYLSNRYQLVRIGLTLSSYLEALEDTTQCSVLGQDLFNIFLNHLTFFIQETVVSNFV